MTEKRKSGYIQDKHLMTRTTPTPDLVDSDDSHYAIVPPMMNDGRMIPSMHMNETCQRPKRSIAVAVACLGRSNLVYTGCRFVLQTDRRPYPV
jgi:hypothetical protein